MKRRRVITRFALAGMAATAVTQLCSAGSAIAHFVHVLLNLNTQ